MGVDYSGNYGIGVKINFNEDESEFDDIVDHLDSFLEDDDPYNYFEVGSGDYTGESNDWYICIDEPFENGIEGLIKKIDDFYNFLSINNVSYEGDIDCVGGLNIW